LAGWSRNDLSDIYYLALLYHVGCTGAVSIQSRMGAGDDVSVRRWLSEVDFANQPELMRIVITRITRQWGPRQWASGVAGFISSSAAPPRKPSPAWPKWRSGSQRAWAPRRASRRLYATHTPAGMAGSFPTYHQIGGITTVNTRAGTTLFALDHDLVQIQSG
jgi:hypothetical protein